MTVLECKDLSKWYGEVIAVNDLTVDVRPGVTGLLGPNGAGKSSLIRMSTGLMRPSAGTVRVLDEDPWDNAKLLARIGYVPEGDAPWRDHTGRRAAVISARLAGLSGRAAEDAANTALGQVGLTRVADRTIDGYSRGMRQRFKFSLALLHDPDVLILDEPLLGTDPLTRRDLIQLIRGLAERGKSVLLSTHILQDVEVLTQRIMLLNRGRLMAHGEVSEIRDLLDRYPRTVRIATPEPRDLGAELWSWESVLSIQAEEGAVLVTTRRPQTFFLDLQSFLAKTAVPFTSVTSPDDNLESVFKYLVGSS